MGVISVENLKKVYKVHVKPQGLAASVRSLFRRQYKRVRAVDGLSFTIEPGEILVAPVTDAGWTPLFVAAAGIVVDVGGTLSHGSTVAREYGLPAVVNVKHGTRMIRTGQTNTVDGSRGVVLLDE